MAQPTPSAIPATSAADASMARFEAQTTRYGSITMTIGLLFSLAGPVYLFFFSNL